MAAKTIKITSQGLRIDVDNNYELITIIYIILTIILSHFHDL